jgi:hypothetical protein
MSRDQKIQNLQNFLFPNGNETIAAFVPFLFDAGYEDADFILSLKPDEWDVMLDAMVADARLQGVEIKSGHRMHFKKRLRDLQVASDDSNFTPRSPRAGGPSTAGPAALDDEPAPPAGQSGLTIVTSPTNASRPQYPDNADEDDEAGGAKRDLGGDDGSSAPTVMICCEGLRCLTVHWLVCFGTAMCTLIAAICLLVLLNNISTSATAAPSTQSATTGGWVFARVCMIIFFVFASLACCGCILTFCRNSSEPQKNPLADCCPDPDRCGCPTLPVCPSCFDLEACCIAPLRRCMAPSSSPGMCDVACPGLDCRAPDCDCSNFFPSCPRIPLPSLPSCDDVTDTLRKCFNLFACRCKCNVQFDD